MPICLVTSFIPLQTHGLFRTDKNHFHFLKQRRHILEKYDHLLNFYLSRVLFEHIVYSIY